MNHQEKEVFAVHEVGHGIIAVVNGYVLKSVHLDGPSDNPGKIEREIPGGKDGNDPEWAKKELELFSAGAMGEKLIYGTFKRKNVFGHPEGDYCMMLQCALTIVGDENDISRVQSFRDPDKKVAHPRHLWKKHVPIAWAQYDKLIQSASDDVFQKLQEYEPIIPGLAKWLIVEEVVSGEDFIAKMDELKKK